jgi:hypothetical protein
MHGFGHDYGGKGQSIGNGVKRQTISKFEISRVAPEIQLGTGQAESWQISRVRAGTRFPQRVNGPPRWGRRLGLRAFDSEEQRPRSVARRAVRESRTLWLLGLHGGSSKSACGRMAWLIQNGSGMAGGAGHSQTWAGGAKRQHVMGGPRAGSENGLKAITTDHLNRALLLQGLE